MHTTPTDPSPKATTIGPVLMILLMGAVFMVSAEARVISPLLPAMEHEFNSTTAAVGLLISAYSIPYGLFQLVYGPLADRFSRALVIGSALGLFAVGTLISGFAPNLPALQILRFLTGAAAAGVIPITMAYIGDAVPYEQRQSALGKIMTSTSLGGLLSSAMGGIIAEFLSWRALFVAYGLIALLVSVILIRQAIKTGIFAKKPAQKRGMFTPYKQVFQAAGVSAWALYILVFIEGFLANSTQGYLGSFLFERDGLSYGQIGLWMMLTGVATMLTSQVVGKIVRRIGENGMLILGGSMLALSYVLVGLQPMPLCFGLAMILNGSGFACAHSTLQTRATELVPAQRGTAVALFAFSLFMGGGIGTMIAGQLIEKLHYQPTFFITAAALLCFTALSWPLLRIGRSNKLKPASAN